MHRQLLRLLAAWVCGVLCAELCNAQLDSLPALTQRAELAYKSQDYATFLILEKQILLQTPDDPRAQYNVACGEALAGRAPEAVRMLERLLARQLDLGAEKDPDFSKIRQTPEWAQYAAHLANLRKPVVHSTVAFTLPDKGLVASGVAVDQATGDAYVGSVRERKIVKRTSAGVISDFATAKDGLLAVSSLLIDPVRKQLVASVSAASFMQDFRKEDEGKAGICIFDLATGRLLRSAFLPGGREHHLLESMAEDKSGNIFVSDTGTHEVYRLRRASSELEIFLSSLVFRAPHGLALSADERTLYVLDLISGMWAVEVLSNDRVHVEVPAEYWLGGLIGLSRVEDSFVAMQLGSLLTRVVRIRLDAKGERIASVETLDSNDPDYAGPIPGSVSGGNYWYVANSQFALVDTKTGTFAEAQAKPTVVLRLPLQQR